MKMWHGRIATPADDRFETFTSSVQADQRLAPYDVKVSIAHARALEHAGVLASEDAARLIAALEEIAVEIASGTFGWRDDLEDVHTHIEVRLREKIGAVADQLHAGRSRNDQIAADLRLYVKDRTGEALSAILDLQTSLFELARRCGSALMPGYTHLQQAQPVLAAQPLLAHGAMLSRDWERFHDSLARTDRSPLGSGALAGLTFPLDRTFLAEACGFSGVAANSLDAVGDRDFVVEFVATAALCMTHLSRLGEDLVIWSSIEFGFVRLPDAFASGSSMMPQKKNPDVAELVRGKAALLIGDVAGALALVKGLPLGYNRDLQENTTPLYHAADSLLASLEILAAMVPLLEIDAEWAERSISPFAYATDLADYLVERGVPFREAHAAVGGLVSDCLTSGRDLTNLSLSDLQAAVPGTDIQQMPEWTAAASVRRKRTVGSTHPDAVAEGLDHLEAQIAARRDAIGATP
ncbi:MAG TPA: argininosuccinate lyase [Chloroflexota bacterium]